MFYWLRNIFKMSVRSEGYTECFWLSNTKCKQKTPQRTFNTNKKVGEDACLP